ncbi:3-deoxy-D-manno-octulosonic acid transferase, partial [hydrothermal vent metagenome]
CYSSRHACPADVRYLYSLLLYVALPGVFLRLWLKGRRSPGYRRHWRERLGYLDNKHRGAIWLHAVSVGEVRAAGPLILALRQRYPEHPFLLTTTTPTGRQTAEQLYADAIDCRYLPYDLPGATKRFITSLQPALCIIMEVELWPNLYAAATAHNLLLYLINARLSDKSYRGYQRFGRLMRTTLSSITHVAAQNPRDRERFLALGMPPDRVTVVGNLKLDVGLPADFDEVTNELRATLKCDRPLWVAGSTHDGEEGMLLEVHARLLEGVSNVVLVLVPRHPERSEDVVKLCQSSGLACRLYSETDVLVHEVQVLVVDRLGLLVYCYGIAEAAFIGGSLVDHGGHNPVEAVLAGVPLVSGPGVGNFQMLYDQLQQADAVQMVETQKALLASLQALLCDAEMRGQCIHAARGVVESDKGALDRVLQLLDTCARPRM